MRRSPVARAPLPRRAVASRAAQSGVRRRNAPATSTTQGSSSSQPGATSLVGAHGRNQIMCSDSSCDEQSESASLVKHRDAPGMKALEVEAPHSQPSEDAAWLKWASLALLIFQNSGVFLLMRYTRSVDGPLYLTTVTVWLSEFFKAVVCIVILIGIHLRDGSGWSGFAAQMHEQIWGQRWETLRLGVPAVCYTVQNNLLYLAVTHMSAAGSQVLYQSKTLSTALFSVTLLGKRFKAMQWVSFVLLAAGRRGENAGRPAFEDGAPCPPAGWPSKAPARFHWPCERLLRSSEACGGLGSSPRAAPKWRAASRRWQGGTCQRVSPSCSPPLCCGACGAPSLPGGPAALPPPGGCRPRAEPRQQVEREREAARVARHRRRRLARRRRPLGLCGGVPRAHARARVARVAARACGLKPAPTPSPPALRRPRTPPPPPPQLRTRPGSPMDAP